MKFKQTAMISPLALYGDPGNSGGSDTGVICYYFHRGDERYDRVETLLGPVYKMSDDFIVPDDYSYAVVLRDPAFNEVISYDVFGYKAEIGYVDGYPEISMVGGSLFSFANKEVAEEFGIPSTGTWLISSSLNDMASEFYFILVKK